MKPLKPSVDSPLIVGLGELLWDIFPDGPRFGGAPTNFACSAAALSSNQNRVSIATAVGDDDLGHLAIATLASRDLDLSMIELRKEPTGQVLVTLDPQGSATYRFNDNAAWDNLSWNPWLHEVAGRTDAVCFGTLGQRSTTSQQTIKRFLSEARSSTLKILDINLRPPHWTESTIIDSLSWANVLKLNDQELPILGEILGLQGDEEQLLRGLLERYHFRLLALTRGAEGSVLMTSTGHTSRLPGTSITVVDTVGAGDAFTAAVTLGLLKKMPLEAMHTWADQVAAYVCTQPGATPRLPSSLCL